MGRGEAGFVFLFSCVIPAAVADKIQGRQHGGVGGGVLCEKLDKAQPPAAYVLHTRIILRLMSVFYRPGETIRRSSAGGNTGAFSSCSKACEHLIL